MFLSEEMDELTQRFLNFFPENLSVVMVIIVTFTTFLMEYDPKRKTYFPFLSSLLIVMATSYLIFEEQDWFEVGGLFFTILITICIFYQVLWTGQWMILLCSLVVLAVSWYVSCTPDRLERMQIAFDKLTKGEV